MSSDHFFQVRPNNNVSRTDSSEYRYQPTHRADRPTTHKKDFEKILDQEDPEEDSQLQAKEGKTTIGDKPLGQAGEEDVLLSEVDDRFNQAPTLIKDSKISPKLGSEISTAPSEEPRSKPFIESDTTTTLSTNQDELTQQDLTHQLGKLPETMPLNPVALAVNPAEGQHPLKKSPADLFSQVNHEARLHKSDEALAKNKKEDPSEDGGMNLGGQKFELSNNIITQTAAVAQSNKASEIIKALADQLIDHLRIVTDKTQVDTTIQLKAPPLLEGATVTITSYTTARGEFNISFENLTQQAKNMLDMAPNRLALHDALDQKGYTIHMVTTTTVERNYTPENPGMGERQQRGYDDEQPKQQQKQKQ